MVLDTGETYTCACMTRNFKDMNTLSGQTPSIDTTYITDSGGIHNQLFGQSQARDFSGYRSCKIKKKSGLHSFSYNAYDG